jgi:cysteinyl-tRNA synthetase
VDLKLFSPLTRTKEPFEPLVSGKVSVYTCGPTAHAPVHVGDMRRFVFADLLCRYLTYREYDVTHIMNITDLDDKTIEGSEKARMDLSEFTGGHLRAFKKDLDRLGIKPADGYPRASENVDAMVKLAEKLAQKGYAYEKLRSLYFDISRFADYGKLSGIDINKVKLGVTVDLDDYEKDNPRDFTLLKRTRLSELKRGIYTKTDWGNVRPSWHLQGAAMAMKHLGDVFDIHASSRELVFPHHENVNAIVAAVTGRAPVKYWVDCERVLVDGKKVDEKEAGMTLQEIMYMGYSGREIRYWLMASHYRKPITFSENRLDDARRSLERINNCIRNLANLREGRPYPDLNQLLYDLRHGFIQGMDDDLNISAAMVAVFRIVKKINVLIADKNIDADGARQIYAALQALDTVLNAFDFDEAETAPDIRKLIEKREKARLEKNWQAADRLREQLQSMGVNLQDSKISH